MRLDARTHRGPPLVFVDLDAGREIRWLVWADLPDDPALPGEYEAFREDPVKARQRGVSPDALRYRGRCRLRAVPRAGIAPRPSDPRDLAGSLDEGRRRFGRVRPVVLIPGLLVPGCDEPRCHRPALWSVTDEVAIEPEVDAAGAAHERAVCAFVRHYCTAHWRPPTHTDLRGVQNEVDVTARPQ